MLALKDTYEREQGSIILMVLIMFLLVSFLGAAAIELGLMEYKSSHYDFQAGQAQHAVDAAVDWGLENIYTELTLPANLTAPTLPACLNCSNQMMLLDVGGQICEVSIGEVINTTGQSAAAGSCIYEYTATATFEGAWRKVTVQATYFFNGGYQYIDAAGNMSIMPREYLNRGKISSYLNLI